MSAFVPLIDVGTVIPILSKIAIFGGLSDSHLYKVFRVLRKGSFNTGDIIFREGDSPQFIYIVKSGTIDLVIPDNDIIIEKMTLRSGECFGESAFMAIQRQTATAISLDTSEVMVFSKDALKELHNDDLELFSILMMNIARELARRLEQTDKVLLRYINAAQ